jgi:hypothetical protein
MRLEEIGSAIWLAEGGIVSCYGFPYPIRSVIVRLAAADLWVWSPVALTPDLRTEIDRLGKVAHLVSPNKLHHLYLRSWKEAYPGAMLWGPRSAIKKRKDLSFQAPLRDEPPVAWQGVIDQAWFRGSPFMDEVVFFHRPSATAILADLCQAFSPAFLREHWSWWQRLVAQAYGITEGKGYAPFEWRISFVNRQPARAAFSKVLSWAPKQVVMAHGTWQREDGLVFLRRAFRWLEK